MNVEFLVDDLEELAEAEIAPREALLRGLKELGSRPTHDKPQERPDTEAGVRELTHLYAEAAAYMRLMQFAYATSADEYRRSRQRYYRVEGAMADLQREIVPGLRAKLREVGEREAALERALRQRGIEPNAIGPRVPEETAIDSTPRPAELDEPKRKLPPLSPRPSFLERAAAVLRRRRS